MLKSFLKTMNKKDVCQHDYDYLDTEVLEDGLIGMEGKKNYIFKCNKCGEVFIFSNYTVINKILKIFEDLLFEELSKNKKDRLSNDKFIDKVWDSYSNDSYLNNTIRRKLNFNPAYISSTTKDLRDVDDEYLHSLKFSIESVHIHDCFLSQRITRHFTYYIVKTMKGKFKIIDRYDLKQSIKSECKSLNSIYLRQGIKKEDNELFKESCENICKKHGIIINQDFISRNCF